MIYDFDRLSHSESLTDLPQALKDEIDAFDDFDPFAPMNTSLNKASLSFVENLPITRIVDEEEPQLKVMQKLGIFGDNRLMEIVEERSEMEVSEFNDPNHMPSLAHLKEFDLPFKLEHVRTEGNDDMNRPKTERDYNDSAKKQQKYAYHQQSSYGDIPQQKPMIDIDMNCIKDFSIDNKVQHIEKIEIVNNNNYYININGKDKLAEFFEDASFKKKPKPEKSQKQERVSLTVKSNLKDIASNVYHYDNSASSIKKLRESLMGKRRSAINTNTKSQLADLDSMKQIKAFSTSSNSKTHFKTPKQAKNNFEYDTVSRLSNINQNGVFVDLYGRADASSGNNMNIYKKRQSSIGSSKRLTASIDHLSKRDFGTVNLSLSRVDAFKSEKRTDAFKELFGNDDIQNFKNKKNIANTLKFSSKESNFDMITKSQIYSKNCKMSKTLVPGSFAIDRLSVKSVITPTAESKPKGSTNISSNFKKKPEKKVSNFEEDPQFFTSIGSIQRTLIEQKNEIISHFNIDNNIYNNVNRGSTVGSHSNHQLTTNNFLHRSTDYNHKKNAPSNRGVLGDSKPSKKNKQKPSGRQSMFGEMKGQKLDLGENRFKDPIYDRVSKHSTSNFNTFGHDVCLRSLQLNPKDYGALNSGHNQMSFKSIQLKEGLMHKSKDTKPKERDSKATTNFLEKNKNTIEKSRDSNYDLMKVCQANQKFFEKVKMMSKI